MLLPGEFSVGHVEDAIPLTLMLPRSKYEHMFLIGGSSEEPVAIFLSGQFQYYSFRSTGNNSYKGILIPNVTIEVDPSSLFDADSEAAPLGTIVRRGASLGVMTKLDGRGIYLGQFTPLISRLPEASEGCAAGFRRWAITLGARENHRSLFEVDLTKSNT